MENIKFCPDCGNKLSDQMAFCVNCGVRLSASSKESQQEQDSQEKNLPSSIAPVATPIVTSLPTTQKQQNDTANISVSQVSANTVSPQITPLPELTIEFRGTGSSYFFIFLGTVVASGLSGGLFFPWGCAIQQRWTASHTYVNNQPLVFHGKGLDLLIKLFFPMLLTMLSLGLAAPWCYCCIQKWKTENLSLTSTTL